MMRMKRTMKKKKVLFKQMYLLVNIIFFLYLFDINQTFTKYGFSDICT